MLTKKFTISSGLTSRRWRVLYFVNVIKISISFPTFVLVISYSVTFCLVTTFRRRGFGRTQVNVHQNNIWRTRISTEQNSHKRSRIRYFTNEYIGKTREKIYIGCIGEGR